MEFTPQNIEKRLFDLSLEIDKTQEALTEAETGYIKFKGKFEIDMAKTRLSLMETKMTQAEREDRALTANEDTYLQLNAAEVLVKALRQKMANVKTQVDIARSIGSSVRASMDLT